MPYEPDELLLSDFDETLDESDDMIDEEDLYDEYQEEPDDDYDEEALRETV